MKLPGDLARRLRTVLERHGADNLQSPGLAEIIDDVVRDAEGEFSIQIRGNISKGQHCERLRSDNRKGIACKMLLKKTPDFLDSQSNDDNHEGIEDEA